MVWWECRFDTPGTEGNDVDIFPYREAVRKTVIFFKNNSYKGEGGGLVFLNFICNFGGHCFWP